jgi:hypothetical protein
VLCLLPRFLQVFLPYNTPQLHTWLLLPLPVLKQGPAMRLAVITPGHR